MALRPGSGLMIVGASVTFSGLCIGLVKVFHVPDYVILLAVGIGAFALGLIRYYSSKAQGGGI